MHHKIKECAINSIIKNVIKILSKIGLKGGNTMKQKYTYQDLLGIITTLRSENGCAWDRAQTHESLVQGVIEESYELVEAINNKDEENLKEELGDVLLQVLMHAEIAKEKEAFDITDVIDTLATKLVYRHPHVFDQQTANTLGADEVQNQWDALKKKEKHQTSITEGMESVVKALPALIRANKVHHKAAKVGFVWEDYEGVLAKVKEELEEVREAIQIKDKKAQEEELGDLLFSVVALSSFLEINPEFALTKSTEKFINRFRYIENTAFVEGKHLLEMTLQEMDALWNESKKAGSNI